MVVCPILESWHGCVLSYRQRTTKGYMTQTQAFDVTQGLRPTLALRIPWYVDIVAMVVRKVEQGSRMGRVKNSLKDTA